jgi:hypothetical protein
MGGVHAMCCIWYGTRRRQPDELIAEAPLILALDRASLNTNNRCNHVWML